MGPLLNITWRIIQQMAEVYLLLSRPVSLQTTTRPIAWIVRTFKPLFQWTWTQRKKVGSKKHSRKYRQSPRLKHQIQILRHAHSPHSKIVYMNKSQGGICREWNFLPITNCHTKPQNSCSTFKAPNYKKPCIIISGCHYHYSETNDNIPSVKK